MDPGPRGGGGPASAQPQRAPAPPPGQGKQQVLLVPVAWRGRAGLNLFLKIRPLPQLLTACSTPLPPCLAHQLPVCFLPTPASLSSLSEERGDCSTFFPS